MKFVLNILLRRHLVFSLSLLLRLSLSLCFSFSQNVKGAPEADDVYGALSLRDRSVEVEEGMFIVMSL